MAFAVRCNYVHDGHSCPSLGCYSCQSNASTGTTTSISTRRCALNSAPRPPPFRGGYLIFASSGGAAARGGLVRRMDTPKSDADSSSSDAMKMTPVRGFFRNFYRGTGYFWEKCNIRKPGKKPSFSLFISIVLYVAKNCNILQ